MSGGFDVAVVGGGIHGASVAEAAAAAGHSVLLLEKSHPAYGTSSRSSKLIHGGLRYLESGQLKLVAECLRERAILLRRAPQLVRLRPFLIPLYTHSQRRGWQIRTGLGLYSLLGRFGPGTRFGALPKASWPELDGLRTQGLRQVFRYFDAQTDDAALTRAVLASARELGASIQFPARFEGARRAEDGWQLRYRSEGRQQTATARCLVNAGGPWANAVLAQIDPAPPPLPVDWVQGTHILIDAPLRQGVYYVEAEDHRAVFVMPWQGQTLVGTTELVFEGEPDRAAPTEGEIHYLLRTLGRYFPELADRPLLSAFAGLRVLPRAKEDPFGRPRETQFLLDETHRPTLLTIYGGKLTAARATAEQVLDTLKPSLPRRTVVADTRERLLKPF